MRFSVGLVLVLALGVMGCSETSGSDGTAGAGGDGGSGGASGESGGTFSYSVVTSNTGDSADLLHELRGSALPTLEAAGAVVYALWGPAPQQDERFAEIAEDKLVVMLSWAQVDAELLTTELEALTAASHVETTLWEAALRGDEPLPEPGFFAHRFELYRTEDIDQVLSLTEGLWATWEPYWGTKAVGVWRNLEEKDELTLTFRIAWYEDLAHWEETRNFLEEPESAAKLFERIRLLQAADEGWSAGLLER